jgi:hypothetical protein
MPSCNTAGAIVMAEWLKDFASAGLKMKTLSALLVVFGQRLNQAALAGLARKARTPSMKASTCGSVPMVTRHQFS